MLIKFQSHINNQGKTNDISFTAPVTISKWKGFKVFEFVEPAMKEQNRIEINDQEVNIFSGANTLNLVLGEKINVEYLVQGTGRVYFQTHLQRLNNDGDKITIFYTLINKDIIIGEYEISLEIIK